MTENIVLYLSDNAYVDTTGKSVTLASGFGPKKASGHGRRDCKCGKTGRKCIMLSC